MSFFTLNGEPLSEETAKNYMAHGFQSALSMLKNNQRTNMEDLTKNNDN